MKSYNFVQKRTKKKQQQKTTKKKKNKHPPLEKNLLDIITSNNQINIIISIWWEYLKPYNCK